MANNINGYALALFSIATQEKKLKSYKEESNALIEAFDANKQYVSMLNTKSIHIDERKVLITKAFKKLNKNLLNFAYILIERSKVNLMVPILKKLVKLINGKNNVNEGVVYSTIALTKTEVTKIETRTSKIIGKKVELVNKIDNELISGIKIIVGDEVIEDTVVSRFEQLRAELLEREGV